MGLRPPVGYIVNRVALDKLFFARIFQKELGTWVMLIGEKLPRNAGDLVCQLPTSPLHWQFVIDVLRSGLRQNGCLRIEVD